jgi:hypothetical protein
MEDQQPALTKSSVRYVKNGAGGRWWTAAQSKQQIHAGWPNIPDDLLLQPDFAIIRDKIRQTFGTRPGSTQDFNALRCLLDVPDRHIWITFEDGYMWWCTVRPGVEINPKGMNKQAGHFWLNCERGWSNRSLGGKLLVTADLPGLVTTVMGFKGTVCEPKASVMILRLIHDEQDPDVLRAADARTQYEAAVQNLIRRLSPRDFEQLVDLLLARSGWTRIASLGGNREGVDVEVENPAIGEIAFVQVKSAADQKVLDDYIHRFSRRRDRYTRMIFAVHSPKGPLVQPPESPVQIWTGGHLASVVVRLGLAEWLAGKLG